MTPDADIRLIMRQRGFTLIELMVAVFITAILFAIGYGAVNQAVKNREALEQQQERLLAIQTAMRTIAQDVNQLALRPIRDPTGNDLLPVIIATASDQKRLVELTRGGWANPAGVQRPALQRVVYLFEENTLRREYWPVLDPLLSTDPIKKDLLHRREVGEVPVHGCQPHVARHLAAHGGEYCARAV